MVGEDEKHGLYVRQHEIPLALCKHGISDWYGMWYQGHTNAQDSQRKGVYPVGVLSPAIREELEYSMPVAGCQDFLEAIR